MTPEPLAAALATVEGACQDLDDFNEAPDGPTMRAYRLIAHALAEREGHIATLAKALAEAQVSATYQLADVRRQAVEATARIAVALISREYDGLTPIAESQMARRIVERALLPPAPRSGEGRKENT